LTGTPIQNQAEDFGALIGFLRVYPFDSPAGFCSNIINFIQKGDNRGIEKLKALVQAISLRRTKESVFGELKLRPRVERLQLVELDEVERALYTTVKRSWTYAAGKPESVRNIFQTITKLRQICDHGRELLSQKALAILDQGFIKGERMETISEETQLCENCGLVAQHSGLDEIADHLLSCLHLLCSRCLPRSEGDNTEEALCPVCSGSGVFVSFLQDEALTAQTPDLSQNDMDIDISYRPSSKVFALMQNLHVDRLKSTHDPIKR
jgi:SNF2 family DNA or RNA helicase